MTQGVSRTATRRKRTSHALYPQHSTSCAERNSAIKNKFYALIKVQGQWKSFLKILQCWTGGSAAAKQRDGGSWRSGGEQDVEQEIMKG